MSGEFELDGSRLRELAKRLDGVGSTFDSALRLAREGSLPAEAYGKIATAFPPIVRAVGDVGMHVLAEAVASIEHVVDQVRRTADLYDGVDGGVADALKGKQR
ncbi:MAG: hypothetical protein HOV94_04830 [Saccharothrix sp.]|nr:hypothetical protein [Saccharothrix sp.]